MLILRIRQAEVALSDGRLDEAFELIRPEPARTHRRGQRVMGKLVRALIRRGETHLSDERYLAALADCEKAQQLAGNLPDIVELRRKASDAMLDQQKVARRSAQVLAAAQQHIDRGELSRGAQLLKNVGEESRAVFLMNEIEAKRDRLERAPELRQQLQQQIEAGRLDLADLNAAELRSIDGQNLESQALLSALDQCRSAWQMIQSGELRRAEEAVRRLANMFPKAKWVAETSRQLSELARMMEEVRSGPLSMLAGSRDTTVAMPSPKAMPKQMPPPGAPGLWAALGANGSSPVTNGSLPSKFILRVDGAGSFLVLRQPSVTIGPVSSSRVPDVGVMAEPGLPVATIDRVEDDYFLRGSAIAGNKLLASGDPIALSPRCKMNFILPHVASTTAVIDLTAARHPRSEIRRIILLDRDLVIGPGPNTHVRADQLTQPVVLKVRGDRLVTDSGELPLGQTVQTGNVSLVISNA
jgi:tetratricopeptide (TPR) repeat protein